MQQAVDNVDDAVNEAKIRIPLLPDEIAQLLACSRIHGPMISKLFYNVVKDVYGARALHTEGKGQVKIAYKDNYNEPASIVFTHDSHDLECLLDDGTTFRGTCAEIVDFLKQNVPV